MHLTTRFFLRCRLAGFLLGLLILAPSPVTAGSHRLPEFRAQYAATFMGMKVAEALYVLEYTDDGYRFSQQTRLSGLASLLRSDTVDAVSYVEDHDGELLLQKHEYRQRGGDGDVDEKFSIRWNRDTRPPTATITGEAHGRPLRLTSRGPVWEPLSFQLPLMLEARPDKKDYPYQAVLKGELDTYHFVLQSTGTQSFAGKSYPALHMVRTDPRKDKDRQLHIWLIPALHNMPVLIENYRDGKLHSRMELEKLQINHGVTLSRQDDSDDEF